MSGGILGGFFSPQGQGTGLLGNIDRAVGDNSDSMVGLGLGLMSGNMETAMQGYSAGNKADTLRRQQKLLQDQELQKRTAAKGYAEKMGIDPRMADANPDGVLSLWQAQEQRRLVPKEPSEFEQLTRGMDPALVQQAKMAKLGLGGDKPTDEIREYKFDMDQRRAAGQPVQNFGEWKTGLKRAGAVNVNTNVGGGTDKQIFDTMEKSAAAAQSAQTGLTSLAEARQAVESGGIFGAGADVRLGLQKAAVAFGADPTKVTNTETFRSAIAPQVSAMMKATVGSTQISNADREFAEKAAGGAITLEPTSIKRLMDIMERASNAVIENHQKRLDSVYPDGKEFGRERALFGVQGRPAPRGKTSSGLSWSVD